jgi:YVTN family beta-propeller protein
MKRKTMFAFPLFVLGALCSTAHGQTSVPTYKQIATIALPGGLGSFDISWVDPGSQRYYLADRTATAGTGRIDVIDTQKNTFLYSIGGFVRTVAGSGKSGPIGVVAIPQLNQLYVGDGDSTVKVVDLAAQKVIATIPTGGKVRADELAYDPLDHIIMIANPNDNPPF